MGWGDEIIVSGQARRLQATNPLPVYVLDADGRPRWHPIWLHNPRLLNSVLRGRPPGRADRFQILVSGTRARPYLAYGHPCLGRDRYVYSDWRVERGEIYLTREERRRADPVAGAVIIEPNLKPGAPPTKDWGFWRYQTVVRLLPGLDWVQIGPQRARRLQGVRFFETPSKRHAAAAMSRARAFLAPEGGLHHCAACFDVPGAVIFGGYIHPRTTGYDLHVNFFTGGEACGNRLPCAHCAAAMDAISPESVAQAMADILGAPPGEASRAA